jgi:hypothetical protein
MSERRTVGHILLAAGRITEEEMSAALEYQRDHGGYFGEALLACGYARRDEVEWGLAVQHGIPYVLPDAAAVEREAARLVSRSWALAHLLLPVARTRGVLKVVAESPARSAAVEELEARTGLAVELSLCPADLVRELVEEVLGGEAPPPPEPAASVGLEEGLGQALDADTERFGISTRQHSSWFWWEEGSSVRRRRLEGMWRADLEELLVPPPGERVQGRHRATWAGQIKRRGMVNPVEVRYLSGDAGHEYVFRPVRRRLRVEERFGAPPSAVRAQVRLLARSGSVRFLVAAEPAALGHEILPHLPILLLDPSHRAVHVHAGARSGAADAFRVTMPRDTAEWPAELEILRAFDFDAVTADLAGREEAWGESVLGLGGVAFLFWPAEREPRAAFELGVRWTLRVTRDAGGQLDWSLAPLHL